MHVTARGTLLALILASSPIRGAAETADDDALLAMSWDEVVEEARGGEVNWFLWGGADNVNRYVTEYVGRLLEEHHDITLNRVGLNDTVEAVNIVLGEKEAGITEEGSVDLIWINGENFRTMRQADLVFCGHTDMLPNDALIDWDDPSIASDFGVPVEGCEVPWSRVQFAFAYDTARTGEPPRSIAELIEWVEANPGQFTYPAPPDFNGAAFVRHVFYHAAGGPEALDGPFDQATFDAVAPEAWRILREMEPHLWREGRTYPNSISALQQLFANREVALLFDYEPAQFGLMVQNGTLPETVRSYGLEDGTLANTSYTAIPFNSPNKAAAMVTQNLLLSGEAQLEKARPEVWGTTPAIEVDRTAPEIRDAFGALERHPAVVPAEELGRAVLPELEASWIAAIERGWAEAVGR